MLSSALFTLQDTLKVVPIYLALAFRRFLPFIRNPMAALPEQVGFLANADGIDSGTKFKEVAIDGRSHVETDSRTTNFGNAEITEVIWRKVRNDAQHEFIVMHLRENRAERPRTSVVIVDRSWDKEARVSDNRSSIPASEPSVKKFSGSSTSLGGTRAHDRFRFSRSGTDDFVTVIYPFTEVIVEEDFSAYNLNLLHVASLAEAIHERYPDYKLFNDNCYSFANLLFQGLLSIITTEHPETDFTQKAGDLRRGSRSVVEGKWRGIITARKDLTKMQALPNLMATYQVKIAAAIEAAREAPAVKLGEALARERQALAQKDQALAQALALVAQKEEEIARLKLQLGST